MNKISTKSTCGQYSRLEMAEKIDQQIKKLNVHHNQLFWKEVGCVWL